MSGANAKGGAKHRKNKRRTGGGDHRGMSSNRDCQRVVVTQCGSQDTSISAPDVSAEANRPLGEGAAAGACAGDMAPRGYLETPFNIGETQRTPLYPAGNFCVLCSIERKDSSLLESGIQAAIKLGLSMAPEGNSAQHQLPWVCLHCEQTMEKLRNHSKIHQPTQGQDFLVRCPLGGSPSESGSETSALGAQPLPFDAARAFEACTEPRELCGEVDSDRQLLGNCWSQVRYAVHCIYHQIGTAFMPSNKRVKELIDRLYKTNPAQLYQRLDKQARHYVLEIKIRLLRKLAPISSDRVPSCLQSPLQAHQFISLLLEEYGTLCQAARTISTLVVSLENNYLNKYQITWELHNKHLFENLIFSEPLFQTYLAAVLSQITLGTMTHDPDKKMEYITLLQQYQHLVEELYEVAKEWLECEKRINDHLMEAMTLKNELTEEVKRLQGRRFLDKQLSSKRAGTDESNLTEAMGHMLLSPICVPCHHCQKSCASHDCRCSNILICGIEDSPTPSSTHIHQPPLNVGSAPTCLSESLLPGVSLESSALSTSSPIKTQQHPRLIHTNSGSSSILHSDDDVSSLSAKCAETNPSDNYNIEVVTSKRSDAPGDPAGLSESSRLALSCFSADCEGYHYNKGICDLQKEGRDKSIDTDSNSEHSYSTCTNQDHSYYNCCCEDLSHDWPSLPTGRTFEDRRERLRLRLAKKREEQRKKTDQLSGQKPVVDHRSVEELLQFINSSETKPMSSTRAAKRERHKQRKVEKTHLEAASQAQEHVPLSAENKQHEEVGEPLTEEFQQLQKLQAMKKKERPSKDRPKLDILGGNFQTATGSVPDPAHMHSGSLEQTEASETSSHPPSRQADHPGPGAHGDSKLLLSKEVCRKQQEPFLLDIKHHHKEGTGKQKLKQARKARSEPMGRPVESLQNQPRFQPQTQPKTKVLNLTSLTEQKKKERKVSSNNNNKKQLDQAKVAKASPGPAESSCPSKHVQSSKLVLVDTPQPRGKSKKNRKKEGDGDDSWLDDVFLPKDIDLESVDMDETEREVEYFKRFCLDSARQTRQRLSIDWSNFSMKKPPFPPTE